jgi:hypothetical protein
MEDLYIDDDFFGQVYEACENSTFDKKSWVDGYSFKEKNIVCTYYFYT